MNAISEVNAVLRQDLLVFVEKVFLTLNPGQEYLHNWHIEAIVHLLCEVTRATGSNMTVSAAKPEEKRLGWFVPTAVDQAESCVKPAAEGRNLARMPNPQHSETERLDHGPNWLKHTEDGLLLGECEFKEGFGWISGQRC